ncbi:hypothetical protein [Bradyrhizobium sp. CB3481]|uniref:hypothetical protein n=1 Tax=Bradyrhizobium sp. CB3481 TaxID=3039158 RepID=UPI0024B1499E|nr:hypothetical protein [Bradyrhizobium sp. CB3481]WFU18581.1 hypothetical protein QA643_09680 [Bradyrhizobium sp. CB3481]
MGTATAERIPALAGGVCDHSNMSKICRKLTWLHVDARHPVRSLTLGSENEGHWATPSIWRGSNLKWFELDAPGARTSAGARRAESIVGAVARNLIRASAGHKGRSALLAIGSNE